MAPSQGGSTDDIASRTLLGKAAKARKQSSVLDFNWQGCHRRTDELKEVPAWLILV
jgi:hypothetical protein